MTFSIAIISSIITPTLLVTSISQMQSLDANITFSLIPCHRLSSFQIHKTNDIFSTALCFYHFAKMINKPLNSVRRMVVSRWLMYTKWLLNSRRPPRVRRISCPGITRELRRVGCRKRYLTYCRVWIGCWIQNQLFWCSDLYREVNSLPVSNEKEEKILLSRCLLL